MQSSGIDRLLLTHRNLVSSIQSSILRQVAAPDNTVIVTNTNHTAIVTLNRPKLFNALSSSMLIFLNSQIMNWKDNPDIKLVILKGTEKKFAAGYDLLEVAESVQQKSPIPKVVMDANPVIIGLSEMKPILISFWDGLIMGGGVGISISSKIKIVTENTVFSMPECKIGIFNNAAAGFYLPRIRSNIGLFIGFTGRSIHGVDLVKAGIADYYVQSNRLSLIEQELSKDLNKNPDMSLEDMRNVIKKHSEDVKGGFPNEDLIKELFQYSTFQEIYEQVKLKAKDNEFAKGILRDFDALSPLFLLLSFELLKRGKDKSLREAIQNEEPVYKEFGCHPDCLEGIYVALKKKQSTKPVWFHKSIYDVSNLEVQKAFP